jgi:hypothetical protein
MFLDTFVIQDALIPPTRPELTIKRSYESQAIKFGRLGIAAKDFEAA